MSTLGDEYSKEQMRVRKLLGYYKEIGPAGMFGAMMIEAALKEADAAAVSGDLERMIIAFNELKSFKE